VRNSLFWIFIVYLVLLIIRPHEFIPGLEQPSLLQMLLLASFAFWILSPNKQISLPQFGLLTPFMLVVWIGMGLNGWWGGIAKVVDKLLPPIFVFIVASGAVRSLRQLHIFMIVLIACASVLVLHGHYQLQFGVGWTGATPIQGRMTYSGIFNDPNDLGLLLVVAVAMIIYLGEQSHSHVLSLVLLATFGWMGYGVYLTDSRGTMLASLMVLAFHVWRRYGKTALIAAGVLAVPVLVATTRLAQIDADEASAEGRLEAWYVGIQLLKSHPLFGVGYSNFVDHHYLTAHNSLVLAMAELGLIGFSMWLAFVGYSGYMLYWLSFKLDGSQVQAVLADDRSRQPDLRAEVAASRALFSAAIGFAVAAFFLSQSYKFLLFLLCGIAVGRYAGVGEVFAPLPKFSFLSDLGRWLVLAAAIVIGLWVALHFLL